MTDFSATDQPLARRMEAWCRDLQSQICAALESQEREMGSDAAFSSDVWERVNPDGTGGGGGTSRVIEGGKVFEKGGVNVSAVHGPLPERMAQAFGVDGAPFFATGISLVLHPANPFVPAVHANFRYFALGTDLARPADQWFGGGGDLTPVYPTTEDAEHFHRTWKSACDRHPAVADYQAYKEACDRYFYLPHRGETRGVGGIFYDYERPDEHRSAEAIFAFAREAGASLMPAYLPLVERHRGQAFSDAERRFQALRRGRYAEFNLAYDRGTRFGLETGGRTESILMSLPPRVEWAYAWDPATDPHYGPDSPEAAAMAFFTPRDWLGINAEETGG